MQTSHLSVDEPRAADTRRRSISSLRAAVGAGLASFLLLAAAPLAAQQPQEASEQDPFAGSSVFERAPDQGVTVSRLSLEAGQAPPLVSASDFYGASFVADWSQLRPRGMTTRLIRTNPLGLEMPPTVRGGDRVVLSLGGLSVEPGDTLQAVRRGQALPEGRHVVRSVALVEVSKVHDDSARARVRSVYGSYQVGDPVVAGQPFRARGVRELQPAGKSVAVRIIGLETSQALVGTNDRVFVDAGSEAGLSPGDELMVFPEGTADPAEADPEDRLGVLRLVRVREGASTARVVETRDVGMGPGSVAVIVRRATSGDR